MSAALRLLGLFFVFVFASVAWLVLAGVMDHRSNEQSGELAGRVSDLWGSPQNQAAPTLIFQYPSTEVRDETLTGADGQILRDSAGTPLVRRVTVETTAQAPAALASTTLAVDLHLDQRRKGLLWFSLYDVDFTGDWTYTHDRPESGWLAIRLPFPDSSGVYDDFHLSVDGVEKTHGLVTSGGAASIQIPVATGQTVAFSAHYRSRGQDTWQYQPLSDTGRIDKLTLTMRTDFADIDFPAWTLSPSTRERDGEGWKLTWGFDSLVTGHGMGMVMPHKVQAGPLAAAMSLSAPVSLALFMLWLYVLGLLRGIEIHPINHLLLAGAFFAFHLIFGYTADRLPIEVAFGLASVVSMGLVISYLRLVTGPRFAIIQAGGAQLVYLIGFSLAHFFDGFTGLTITILGVLTLFAIMQLTGRIKWAEVMARQKETLGA